MIQLFNVENNNQPKALWVKTRKGRGYLKYDEANPDTGKKAMINVLIGVVILVVLLLIANSLDLGHAH